MVNSTVQSWKHLRLERDDAGVLVIVRGGDKLDLILIERDGIGVLVLVTGDRLNSGSDSDSVSTVSKYIYTCKNLLGIHL